jgi:formylglycine-generating enzyme required for sulfatase activity
MIENPVHASNPVTLVRNSIGMEFILVPAGDFEMGSPSNEKRRKLWKALCTE